MESVLLIFLLHYQKKTRTWQSFICQHCEIRKLLIQVKERVLNGGTMKTSKVEIRQVEGEKGIYTEILIDGHKLEGVRSFELKQGIGDCVPILSIDLNALNLSTDLQMLQVNQKGIGEIEGIKFKGSPRMLKFQAE
nr:MAG TPA: hypothetical protein [Caudoviricetes sp.]DAO46530.1 MAG TPA: hypothetical protein [Caudoviricetes sp.]DAW05053.1 MAG TPA: hypothetical protein [Caudoviricetes sp.]